MVEQLEDVESEVTERDESFIFILFILNIQYLKRNTQLATIARLPCGPL